ncbi:helix-turn-helix domain-containing protein [Halomonas sp. LR5S13]|uniref:helix-turn-helix domain-containing protein n=1 Tax=Halomonas rhizosphaerae TaxID=3043296 RepID=UPI0024A9F9A4|nr:helix-turn-helix domain-containing protein [Halomonas rhizosphaerae]MDI5921004.1 helix-turn-helix domain-containing protein [Halomonas rhizosphaerae]
MSTKHLSPELLNKRRLEAVRLRLDGHTVVEVATRTGLSAPTVSAAWKAFREGGWDAVPVRRRGRKVGQTERLGEVAQGILMALMASHPEMPDPAWSSSALADALASERHRVSARAIEHWLEAQGLKPAPLPLEGLARRRSPGGRWYRQQVQPVLEQVHQAGGAIWEGGVRVAVPAKSVASTPRRYQLYLHGKRGALYTRCLPTSPVADDYLAIFERLLADTKGPVALLFRGAFFQASPEIRRWLEQNPKMHLVTVPPGALPRAGSEKLEAGRQPSG